MHFLPFAAVFACVAVAASVRLPFSEPETSLQDAFNSEMIGPLNSQNISENVLKVRTLCGGLAGKDINASLADTYE